MLPRLYWWLVFAIVYLGGVLRADFCATVKALSFDRSTKLSQELYASIVLYPSPGPQRRIKTVSTRWYDVFFSVPSPGLSLPS